MGRSSRCATYRDDKYRGSSSDSLRGSAENSIESVRSGGGVPVFKQTTSKLREGSAAEMATLGASSAQPPGSGVAVLVNMALSEVPVVR